jgi:hypothetical protein
MHQLSDMITMVLDSEFTANQFRNTGGGPEIGSVAVHHGPLQEKRDQTPSLLPIQLQRSTWGEAHPQPLLSTPASRITPAHLQAKWVLGGMQPKELVQLAVSALQAISLRHKRKPTSTNKTGRFMTRNELRLMRSHALCLIFCSSL